MDKNTEKCKNMQSKFMALAEKCKHAPISYIEMDFNDEEKKRLEKYKKVLTGK